jgi:HAMP domain-containing protein
MRDGRPPVPAGGGRVPLARSFAFRLGAAFALVAIAAAGITALVVNAAFAARIDRYAAARQRAQVTGITAAAGRAYAGGGKWDLHALETLVPAAGPVSVQLVTPAGQDVWQWNGHQMSWNDQWMQGSHGSGQHQTGQGGSGQPGKSSGNCGSWDNCSSGHDGSRDNGSRGEGAPGPAGTRSAIVVAAAAATPSPGPSASPASLGTVQRIPITAGGKVVGTALVRVPQATALPDAVAFRRQVIGLVLAAGAVGALVSLALGIFFARRATRPVRQMTRAAQALAAGDRETRLHTGRRDEFGQMSQAFNALADAAAEQENLRQGFAAEVAHELRTPLTILRSQVEGLRVGVLEPGPGALASLDKEVQRITRLVARPADPRLRRRRRVLPGTHPHRPGQAR